MKYTKNVFDVLGIEEENRKNSKHLIPQYRELQKKHPQASIWLNDDIDIYVNGKVIEKTVDLSAVIESKQTEGKNNDSQ